LHRALISVLHGIVRPANSAALRFRNRSLTTSVARDPATLFKIELSDFAKPYQMSLRGAPWATWQS
jgi:hypothetical protein